MVSEKLDKVLISINAHADLEQMVSEVNDGYTGGRVSKMQLLTWLVIYFRQNCLRSCIDGIRKAHFDELAHLKSVVRNLERAKKSGASDVDLKKLLAPVLANQNGHQRRKESSREKLSQPKATRLDLNSPNGKASDGEIQE